MLTIMWRTLLACGLALTSVGHVEAQELDRARYEAVLFPISSDTITVQNDSDRAVRFLGVVCPVSACPPPPLEGVLYPRTIQQARVGAGGSTAGWLWHVPTADLPALHFSARLADEQSEASGESYGADLPIIQESEMSVDRLFLSALPTSPNYRVVIRVYSPQPCLEGSVRVSFLRRVGSSPGEISGFVLPLVNHWRGQSCEFPELPASAELVPLSLSPGDWSGDLLFESLTPGQKFWAFAEITSNQTGTVTLLTPQRLKGSYRSTRSRPARPN